MDETVRLSISQPFLSRIEGEALRAFPEECCGLLIGRVVGEGHFVEEVQAAENVSADDRRKRYEIDPQTAFDALRMDRRDGLQVVGFYHSHTDGSREPSAHDVETAWPGKSYLIVSVVAGNVLSVGSWRLSRTGECMVPERLN